MARITPASSLSSHPTVAASSERFGLTNPGRAFNAPTRAAPCASTTESAPAFSASCAQSKIKSTGPPATMVPDITTARYCGTRRWTTARSLSKSAGRTGWLSSTNSVWVPANSSITVRHCRVRVDTVTKSDRYPCLAPPAEIPRGHRQEAGRHRFSPRVLNTLATLMDLPAAPSSVAAARLTVSSVSFRKTITRCTAGVVPMQQNLHRTHFERMCPRRKSNSHRPGPGSPGVTR